MLDREKVTPYPGGVKFKHYLSITLLIGSIGLVDSTPARAQSFFQGFNGTALPADWTATNESISPGNPWTAGPGITDGDGNIVVAPQEGDGFAITNYSATASTAATGATISNWLISPTVTLQNGDTFSFFTTTTPGSIYADRLQLRLSTAGGSVNVGATPDSVGDFAVSLLDINPTLADSGYPQTFTQYTATVSGLTAPTQGRFAFRYFVTDAGVSGNNSNIIGIDSVNYTAAVPEPATVAWLGLGTLLLGLGVYRRRSQPVA